MNNVRLKRLCHIGCTSALCSAIQAFCQVHTLRLVNIDRKSLTIYIMVSMFRCSRIVEGGVYDGLPDPALFRVACENMATIIVLLRPSLG